LAVPSADNLLVGITERIRTVVEHQQGRTLGEIAESILLEADPFRRLIEDRGGAPDRDFVLDVVASLAYCQGVDPSWLLTGRYDSSLHRHVLSLGEERGAGGPRRVREFVQEQFERLRRNTPPFLSFPALERPNSD
jgi:hypothetical protein